MPLFTDTVRLDRHKILMETYTPGDGFDIPIISYTSGISVQGGIWFCGLRDSKVEPRNGMRSMVLMIMSIIQFVWRRINLQVKELFTSKYRSNFGA